MLWICTYHHILIEKKINVMCPFFCFFVLLFTAETVDSGNSSEAAPKTPEPGPSASNEELGDVPDEDEIFNINIPTSDKEPTYFFEEDDEAEEALRNLSIEGDTSEAKTSSNKQQKNKKAWIKCSVCPNKYETIKSYLIHKQTHAMSGNIPCFYNKIYMVLFSVFLHYFFSF